MYRYVKRSTAQLMHLFSLDILEVLLFQSRNHLRAAEPALPRLSKISLNRSTMHAKSRSPSS